jgi:CYTH domain-containing protein
MNKTLWEIDVFEGALSGLILAEVELQSEDETF